MPRVDIRASCKFRSGTDIDRVGKAIGEAIKSLTGNPAQIIVNERGTPGATGRLQLYQMQQRMRRNNIELMPR